MNYRPARPASFCLIYFSFISQISFGFVQGSGWNDFFFFSSMHRALFYKLSKRIGVSKLWINLAFEFLWLLHKCVIIHFHLYRS